MDQLLTFQKSIELLGSYIKANEKTLRGDGLFDLAKEALNKLRDTEKFRDKIWSMHEELLYEMHHGPKALDVLQILRDNANEHPDLADWLEQNPNPQVAGSAGGYTVDSEDKDGVFSSLGGNAEKWTEFRQLTTSYYQTAHRVIKICEDLPMKSELKALGVTIVRNHLLEHPEGKNSGVIFDTFGFDHVKGPIVKGMRRSDQVDIHPDPGFLANNNEMVINLEKVLQCSL